MVGGEFGTRQRQRTSDGASSEEGEECLKSGRLDDKEGEVVEWG